MRPAAAFDRSARTPGDLKKFWGEDPLAAARWLSELRKASAQPVPELTAVAKILAEHATDSAKIEKLKSYAAQTPQLFELVGDFGAHQKARSSTIGWAATDADPWPEAPAFIGTLKLIEGHPTLVTERGSFALNLGSPNWRDEPETAFLDRTVTVKGFPSADGKSLSIEQFGPGASPDFVSGRILIEGDRVFIAPNGDKPLGPEAWTEVGLTPPPEMPVGKPPLRAEVTDPRTKALLLGDKDKHLADYAPAGVILPGKVVMKDGIATYPHSPDAFYILGRFQVPDVKQLPGHKVLHQIETGYFHKTDAISPDTLKVPYELTPGAENVNPPGDTTYGGDIALAKHEGRRTFYYISVLPPDAKVDGAELVNDRRMEMTWFGRASDLGMHVPESGKATNLRDVALRLPASTPDDAGFAPADAAKFNRAG